MEESNLAPHPIDPAETQRHGWPVEDVLCAQKDRQVGRDNCVQWKGLSVQIPPQRHRHHHLRATVRVHEYPDGRLAIFDEPSCLASQCSGAA
jgi:hypothetical protein